MSLVECGRKLPEFEQGLLDTCCELGNGGSNEKLHFWSLGAQWDGVLGLVEGNFSQIMTHNVTFRCVPRLGIMSMAQIKDYRVTTPKQALH